MWNKLSQCREGTNLNSANVKQLQEPNTNIFNCHSENLEKFNEFTSSNFSNYSESSHLQVDTIFETQNDHLQEHTSGQILKQVQDDHILRGRRKNVGGAHCSNRQAFLSIREAKGTDEVTSRLTLLAELRLGEGLIKTIPIKQKKAAFTLAEVLITLGIVGVVAALTLPALLTNVQERIKKEQVRTIKYKLTQATDSMKSLNLIGPYATTEDFVNELKKHYKISKVCSNDKLRGCWPSDTISTPDGVVQVSSLKTGASIKALALGTSATQTMGIVTADGTPMILAYSPVCNALDSSKTYLWSTVDNKPETNATTNCISAIFDINGAKQPNKIGTDVRTLNSLFGSKQYSATFITKEECLKNKNRLGINACGVDQDYWAGAVKKCHDIGMHLPSMQTLANIAGAKYGRTDIDTHTLIMMNEFTNDSDYTTSTGDCMDYFRTHDWGRLAISNVICVSGAIPNGANSSVASIAGNFWSSSEVSASTAQIRSIISSNSTWYTDTPTTTFRFA